MKKTKTGNFDPAETCTQSGVSQTPGKLHRICLKIFALWAAITAINYDLSTMADGKSAMNDLQGAP